MLKEITMSRKEKAEIKGLIEKREAYKVGLESLSEALYTARSEMWKAVVRLWPNGKKLNHPLKGKWTVFVEVEEDK